MNWVGFAGLGLIGTLIRDVVALTEVVRTRRAGVPNEWRTASFAAGSVMRLAAGGAIAGGLAATDQVNGPVGAVLVGSLGPALLSRLIEFLSPDGVPN